jgi:hypothetical protein
VENGAIAYYKALIPEDFSGDKDLVIKVSPPVDKPNGNPDVYLSTEAEYPNQATAMLLCASLGEDLCVLNRQGLEASKPVYIGIACGPQHNACNFNLRAEFAAEIIMKDAEPVTLYLNANEERILKYFVPEATDITHITISSRAWNTFNKFTMLTQKGNEMPGTDRQLHSWPAWNNGYVAKFDSHCECFCMNCNYTTLISAETAGYYTVMGKMSGSVETIGQEEVYDTVLRFARVCYDY